MYRTLLGILAAFACALLVVRLTFSAAKEEPADYTFINGTEPKGLDPALITGQPEGRVADAIFEGLTRRNTLSLRPEPAAAASWEMSPDGRRWTFRLRPDAVWSDGRPVTAHDFAWSWRRMQEPKLAAEYAYLLHVVQLAEAFNVYEGNVEGLVEGPKSLAAGLDAELARLGAEAGAALEGPQWQGLLAKHKAREHLKGAKDPRIDEALGWMEGAVDPVKLKGFAGAVRAEAERRRGLHAEARKRFGVDRGCFAVDDRTFVVELVAPCSYFLELTCFYPTYPVPRWVVRPTDTGDVQKDEVKDWFLPEKIVSNGPFRLADWRVNHRLRMTKSPTYWGRERVRLQVVDALPIENVTTALNLYLTGKADWLPSNYPQDLVRDLSKRPDFYANPGTVIYFYRFNCTKKPFDDKRVRQAICLAVDRKTIVEHLTQKGEPVAVHFVPPGLVPKGITPYEPPASDIRTDVERARALLAEAGYPGGKGFPPVSILFNTHESHKKIAEFIADRLKRDLGIEVLAKNQEWQAYQDNTRLLKYDMVRAGWISDYPDPNTFLDMWVTNGGNNQTGWSNATYDRLLAHAVDPEAFALGEPERLISALKEPDRARGFVAEVRDSTDPVRRVEAAARLRMHLLREAEAILVQDEFPVMPLYTYVVSGLVRPYVKEFHRKVVLPDGTQEENLKDLHPFHDVWIDEAARAQERFR
jgi:oligopeptide transport system substrate-binding protein